MNRGLVFRTLYLKELRSYFDNFTAYAVTIVLLLVSGYLFASPLFLAGAAELSAFTETAPLLLVFFMPAVTMRLYSEEYKDGTIEILNSLPVADPQVLAAKYLAALTLAAFMLAGTLAYPVTLFAFGEPDPGALAGAYLGLWLTSAMLAAAGVWASALTRNQALAFIASFLAGFVLFLAGKVGVFMPPALAGAADFIGLDSHLGNLSRGVLDTRDLLYYAGFTAFFLYGAWLSLYARRTS
jgi:ABC-2 type transport system permease protein